MSLETRSGSFPPTGLSNSEQTYNRSQNGGIGGDVPNLGWPNQLFSKATGAAALGLPNVTKFTNSDYVAEPIVHPMFINALSDDSQRQYQEGDILFVFKPRWGITNQCYTVFSLWNLNYYLEMAALAKYYEERGLLSTNSRINKQDPNAKDLGIAMNLLQKYRDFPTTLEEFCRDVLFLGVFNTSLDKNANANVKKRNISWISKNRCYIPNICKPDYQGRTVDIGCNLFLWVGFTEAKGPGRMLINGTLQADKTPCKFLQVRLKWEWGSQHPIHCSSYSNGPAEDDIDYRVQKKYQLRMYEEDPITGIVNTSGAFKTSPVDMEVDEYECGVTVKIGYVQRVNKEPASGDIEAAYRSFPGWKTLMRYSTLDVILTPHDVDDIN